MAQVQKPAKLQLTAASTSSVTVTTGQADFGQILDQKTGTLTFTISNIGEGATAGAVTPTLSGSDTSYATVASTTCGTAPLAAGASCTATVTLPPSTVVGVHNTATLDARGIATANPSENSDESFLLVERVVQPAALTLTNAGTSFGATGTAAGANDGTITITVHNATGTSDTQQDSGVLNVSLSNSTDFTVVTASSTCYDSVAKAYLKVLGGGTCTIDVRFTPKSAGAKTTTVSVGATPGGATQTVALTGLGLSDLIITPAGTAALPTALSGTPISGSFVVTNIGNTATKLLRETVGGTNGALFTITNDTCFGQTLVAGQSCTIGLQFVGTSSATAAQTATLTTADGTANNSATAYVKVGGP